MEKKEWHYPKRICVDFDETITSNNAFSGAPTLRPDAKKYLQYLRDLGFTIAIYSCRNNPEVKEHPELMREMCQFIKDNDVPYDEIIESPKPLAAWTIDDRAIHFNGNWKDTVEELLKKNND